MAHWFDEQLRERMRRDRDRFDMAFCGLASVIIGQAIIGRLTVFRAATAVVVGAVLYRVVIQLALQVGLNPNDMKLISAILVVLALVLPQVKLFKRVPAAFKPRNGGSSGGEATGTDGSTEGESAVALSAATGNLNDDGAAGERTSATGKDL